MEKKKTQLALLQQTNRSPQSQLIYLTDIYLPSFFFLILVNIQCNINFWSKI